MWSSHGLQPPPIIPPLVLLLIALEAAVRKIHANTTKVAKTVLVEIAIKMNSIPYWQQRLQSYMADLPVHLECEEMTAQAYEPVDDFGVLSEIALTALERMLEQFPKFVASLRPRWKGAVESDVVVKLKTFTEGAKELDSESPLLKQLIRLVQVASLYFPMNKDVHGLSTELAEIKVSKEQRLIATLMQDVVKKIKAATQLDQVLPLLTEFINVTEKQVYQLGEAERDELLVLVEPIMKWLGAGLSQKEVQPGVQGVAAWLCALQKLTNSPTLARLPDLLEHSFDLHGIVYHSDSKHKDTEWIQKVKVKILKIKACLPIDDKYKSAWIASSKMIAYAQNESKKVASQLAEQQKKEIETHIASLDEELQKTKTWGESVDKLKSFQSIMKVAKESLFVFNPVAAGAHSADLQKAPYVNPPPVASKAKQQQEAKTQVRSDHFALAAQGCFRLVNRVSRLKFLPNIWSTQGVATSCFHAEAWFAYTQLHEVSSASIDDKLKKKVDDLLETFFLTSTVGAIMIGFDAESKPAKQREAIKPHIKALRNRYGPQAEKEKLPQHVAKKVDEVLALKA
eukprot:5590627-Amphidinium_carterae.2